MTIRWSALWIFVGGLGLLAHAQTAPSSQADEQLVYCPGSSCR